MNDIDEQLKHLPKVIHTAYKDRAGQIRRSDVYLYADFSRTDVWHALYAQQRNHTDGTRAGQQTDRIYQGGDRAGKGCHRTRSHEILKEHERGT